VRVLRCLQSAQLVLVGSKRFLLLLLLLLSWHHSLLNHLLTLRNRGEIAWRVFATEIIWDLETLNLPMDTNLVA
jgi:hypothetical protein